MPLPALALDQDACRRAMAMLANRRCRIGIYAGLGCMDHAAALAQVAELLQAPVATSVSGKGTIPDCHPLAVGWGYGGQGTRTAEQVFKDVDLVLAVGVRYSEVSTAFYSIPAHRLIHVDANPNNLGRAVKADLCVCSDAGVFLAGARERRRPASADGWQAARRIKNLRTEECRQNQVVYGKCGVDPMALVLALRRCTQPDAQVFVDVTLTEHWAAEAFQVGPPRSYFNPTDNQAMGWSIPAALGGQVAHPGRQTVTITGDGCFLMTAMEISTAARECLPVKFFILDDQAYHFMQKLQEQAYRRTTATILARLDYAALAKGLGVAYQEILSGDALEPGIRGALQYPGPVLTRVVVDYDTRPVRWIEAVRKRYQDELTLEQKNPLLGTHRSAFGGASSRERLKTMPSPGVRRCFAALRSGSLRSRLLGCRRRDVRRQRFVLFFPIHLLPQCLSHAARSFRSPRRVSRVLAAEQASRSSPSSLRPDPHPCGRCPAAEGRHSRRPKGGTPGARKYIFSWFNSPLYGLRLPGATRRWAIAHCFGARVPIDGRLFVERRLIRLEAFGGRARRPLHEYRRGALLELLRHAFQLGIVGQVGDALELVADFEAAKVFLLLLAPACRRALAGQSFRSLCGLGLGYGGIGRLGRRRFWRRQT